MKTEELRGKTKADALKHPNWNMGAKITIDSATLMNKGLELIEAVWLFGLPPEKIQIVVQRQSIVHSAVQFSDNSVIAQLGVPDMRIPIQYALTYPKRVPGVVPELDFAALKVLTFDVADDETFRCLAACKKAIKKGGLGPCAPTVPMRKLSSSSLRTKLASSTLAVWWKQSWTATALAAGIPSAMCTSATAWHESSCAHIFDL